MWHPVPAESTAEAVGVWAPMPLDDGRVWAYRGRPVYTYAGDDGPGQIAGHRFGGASVSVRNWFSAITVADALQTTAAPQGAGPGEK